MYILLGAGACICEACIRRNRVRWSAPARPPAGSGPSGAHPAVGTIDRVFDQTVFVSAFVSFSFFLFCFLAFLSCAECGDLCHKLPAAFTITSSHSEIHCIHYYCMPLLCMLIQLHITIYKKCV